MTRHNQKGGKKKMATEMIQLPQYTCERCDHKWIPRTEIKPLACPKCRSPYWDRPRIRKSSN